MLKETYTVTKSIDTRTAAQPRMG